MNGRTPGSVVTLVTPEPPYWSTQSHRCLQSKLTETTIQWQVVHATTRCAQITPEITPTSGITPLRDQPRHKKTQLETEFQRMEPRRFELLTPCMPCN